ncbi:MAG: DUF368 domain-containing protein, partial [Planctomycetota bacterium]
SPPPPPSGPLSPPPLSPPPSPPLSPPPSPPLSALAGFLMGAADSVPGVSGGTIALVVGVYERLILSAATVLSLPSKIRTGEGRRRLAAALAFLVPLLVGLMAAYWLGTRILVGPEEAPGLLRRADTAPLCYAFFLGLVLASLREPWRRVRRRRPHHFVAALLAAVAAAAFIGLPTAAGDAPTWTLLYGGALAVAVMLLPGVSGSLLLVVLGQYTTVAGAIHDRAFGTFGVFLVGVALGVALFIPLLRRLLERRHDITMAALTGLMAGSLRALWPWKANYDPKAGALENAGVGGGLAWILVAVAAGFLAAWLLALLERRMRGETG